MDEKACCGGVHVVGAYCGEIGIWDSENVERARSIAVAVTPTDLNVRCPPSGERSTRYIRTHHTKEVGLRTHSYIDENK